jgi:hypothetical protein
LDWVSERQLLACRPKYSAIAIVLLEFKASGHLALLHPSGAVLLSPCTASNVWKQIVTAPCPSTVPTILFPEQDGVMMRDKDYPRYFILWSHSLFLRENSLSANLKIFCSVTQWTSIMRL